MPLNTAVAAVNDAPIASGAATLTTTPEDTASPPGATVASLFTPNFADGTDLQQSGANPTGSVANTLAGVAITGNTTPPAEGVWRYSTDGGTTWTDIPTSVSDASALILSAATKIDFKPAPNFNGAPPPLTARLIDSSTDVAITGTTKGADLLSGAQAIAGVDVSGAHNGGTTAVSAAAVPLNTAVAAVNDAPIASGSVSLPPVSSAEQHPPGDTVANLFKPTYNDGTDQQKTSLNPTGSVPDTFAGIVIVGNPVPAADGVWKYSTDGGTTWAAVPTTVSDTNGLVLGPNAKLSFFPSPGHRGAVPPMQVRLIDGSTDVPLSEAVTGASLVGTSRAIQGVDVSAARHGGITAVSAALVPLDTSVIPAEAPVMSGVPWGHFGNDRIYGPGGRPPGYLLGTTVYRSLVTDQVGIINVSADAFYGSAADQHLTYEARMASGASLPPWLTFDANTLNFRGTPPESASGTLDIKVIATTPDGLKATTEVHVFIMRQPSDLLSLLRATRANNAPIRPPAPPRPPAGQKPPAKPPAAPPVVKPTADATPGHRAPPGDVAMLSQANAATPGREGFGLSAQLRDQTTAGRLARARALLDALADAAD